MGKPRRKRKAKIKFRESASLVSKKDKTRVSRPDTAGMRRAPVKSYIPDNGTTFKIKLRKK